MAFKPGRNQTHKQEPRKGSEQKPRKATGPLQTGAGVGVGMLTGRSHRSKKITEKALISLINRKLY